MSNFEKFVTRTWIASKLRKRKLRKDFINSQLSIDLYFNKNTGKWSIPKLLNRLFFFLFVELSFSWHCSCPPPPIGRRASEKKSFKERKNKFKRYEKSFSIINGEGERRRSELLLWIWGLQKCCFKQRTVTKFSFFGIVLCESWRWHQYKIHEKQIYWRCRESSAI